MKGDELPVSAERFTCFEEAARYLCDLPIFKSADGDQLLEFCIDTSFVFFDPRTGKVNEENSSKNIGFRVELKCSPWNPEEDHEEQGPEEQCVECFLSVVHSRNPEWSCSGKTLEEAFLKLANLVHRDYGEESQFV